MVLRHIELLKLDDYVQDSRKEVEKAMDEIREDSSDPDWQYHKGQMDTLREISKRIREIIVAADVAADRRVA